MEEVIEAIYENGVLRPLKKLNLKEGERVRLKIGRKTSKNLSKLLEKYIIDSDTDLTKILVEERR